MHWFKFEGLLRGLLGVSLLLSLGACHEYDDPEPYYDPEVVVSSVILIDASTTRPARMILELENIGIGHAYDVDGSVDLHLGRSIIESVQFQVGVIYEGQSKLIELTFDRIATHDDYDRYSIDYGWYDANRYYY